MKTMDQGGAALAEKAAGQRLTPRLTWLKPLGMLGLSLYNFGMRILTLGIYHFWGKTEVRKRIWSSIRLQDEPLEYTGTGGELLRGFLFIFAIVLLPVTLATFGVVLAFGPESPAVGVFQIALYAVFLLLTGVAIYRAQRYRLARTRWRGIRAALVGSSWGYGLTYFWTMLLIPLTLGWISPWRSTRLQAITTNDMRFGSMPFRFSASSGPLYRSFALFWLLMLAVLIAVPVVASGFVDLTAFTFPEDGEEFTPPDPQKIAELVAALYIALFVVGVLWMILSAWYRAAMIRHFAAHTHIDRADFKSTVSAGGLMWITVSNFFILMLGALLTTLLLGLLIALLISAVAATGQADGLAAMLGDPQTAGRIGGPLLLIFFLSMGMLLPIAQARATGYLVRNLHMAGSVDAAAIAAGSHQDIKRGEGLAQAFDIDAF